MASHGQSILIYILTALWSKKGTHKGRPYRFRVHHYVLA